MTCAAWAQPPVKIQFEQAPAPIGGTWQFREGDDLRWASSPWDERGWTPISKRFQPPQGKKYWARVQVRLPEQVPQGLSFSLGTFASLGQVFINGRLVSPPDRPLDIWHVRSSVPEVYPIPADLLKPGAVLTLAGRGVYYYNMPYYRAAEIRGLFARMGSSQAIGGLWSKSLDSYAVFRSSTWLFGWSFLLGAGYFGYFGARNPDAPEYRYAAAEFGLETLIVLEFGVIRYTDWIAAGWAGWIWIAAIGCVLFRQRFTFAVLRLPFPRYARISEALAIVVTTVWIAGDDLLFRWENMGPVLRWDDTFHLLQPALITLCALIPAAVLIVHAVRGSPIARRVLFAASGLVFFLLIFVVDYAAASPVITADFILGRFIFRFGEVAEFQFLTILFVVLSDRQIDISRERERLSSEFAAARQMQTAMIPEPTVVACGLRFESTYIPAEEVGGDFFQVLPNEDGSVLLVAGDVSGKGLKAAMLVTLIVGMLERRRSNRPAEVLSELNDALISRCEGGFVTCCCALFREDHVFVGNAGHIPPWRNGTPIDVESSLPLGIAAGLTFPETTVSLGWDDRLLFVSDGVTEARNSVGKLLGFDGIEWLMDFPAREIAEKARRFGQEDDITVIAIRHLARGAHAA